jgi:hypothetical protein
MIYYIDDSDKDLRGNTTYGIDGRWSVGLEVQIWGQDYIWMFSHWSLLFFSSLLLISAQYKWRQHGFYQLRI